MTAADFRAVLERHPFLKDGLVDHRDEVLRLAERILAMENTPDVVPVLPDSAPEWEKAYWARRASSGRLA
jgi:hypothetical protein